MSEAYQRLRSSLTAMVLAARGKVTFPQDLARHLKINKNLAWRVSKIIEAPTPEAGIPHLPGAGGLKLLLDAARNAGSSDDVIERVESAHAAFLEMVQTHAGDQETLQLLLDGRSDGDALAASRRMAFRGNSGIVGVQARAKLTASFLAPSAEDPDKLDSLLIGGFVDVCRLRPAEGWPLFRIRHYLGHDGPAAAQQLDAQVMYDRFGQLDEFDDESCSDLLLERDEHGLTYRLGPGRVGKTGTFSTYFGSPLLGVFDRYASPEDPMGEIYSIVEVPVETLLFDMFIHRDLGYGSSLELSVFERPGGGLDDHLVRTKRQHLPISIQPERLRGSPERCISPVCPRYPEVIRRTTAATGWDLGAFTCYRFVLTYPPLHSTAIVSFPLDERPET
ncbi:MAG: hypothetical protein D6695_11570 [Planctomycetota bacterium]|nr:MAG: hypothetical protein D6695_11570 [Planctomycetota bacterium]